MLLPPPHSKDETPRLTLSDIPSYSYLVEQGLERSLSFLSQPSFFHLLEHDSVNIISVRTEQRTNIQSGQRDYLKAIV